MDNKDKSCLKKDVNNKEVNFISQRVFRESFGMLKGKLKKSSQQMKDELRKELYYI